MELALEVDLLGLDNLLAKIEEKVGDAVAETCFAIQREAQRRAPVDTGALKNSIATILFGTNGSADEAGAVAQALNPSAKLVELPFPSSRLEGIVGVTVAHGPHVEYGTTHPMPGGGSYSIPAQPYLEPAMASEADNFETRVATNLEELLP